MSCVAKLGIVSEEADESVFWLTRLLNAKINSTTVELYAPLGGGTTRAYLRRAASNGKKAQTPLGDRLRCSD